MSPLEIRVEDISGKVSLIVTANLADGWRRLGNNFGFYGFAHEKCGENGLISVRVWVIENPPQSTVTRDDFPLDLQSMGSSPSKALAFRLFNGRLSLGAALSTVVNSRRSDGTPGFYKEAVLIANQGGLAYWLRFYAALNDKHPEMPEWTEQDFQLIDEGALPESGRTRELPLIVAEERLTRLSLAVVALEERMGALVKDLQGPVEGGAQGPSTAEDFEKTGKDLREQWSKQFEKQAQAAVEKLREEADNSGRALEQGKQQLASLVEAKLASLSQVAADAAASLEAEQRRSKNRFEDSRRELEDLWARRLAKLPITFSDYEGPPSRRRMVGTLALAAGLLLAVTVPPLGVYLSSPPPPVQMHLQAEAPADFADQRPYWGARHRAGVEETAKAYWRAGVASLQGKYQYGSELPADPPADFQVDKKYAPPGGAKALAETRAHYWEKFRTSWGQRQFWVESRTGNEPWAARLRRVWEKIKHKFV